MHQDRQVHGVPAAFDAGARCLRRPGRTQTPAITAHLRMSAQRMRLAQRRQGTTAAGRGLRHRRVHRRAAVRGAARRDRRRRRVGGDAGRGRRQTLAGNGAVRAQPHRGPRRRRVSTGRSTASSRLICCATSPIPTPNCASSERCCGRARHWRCTNTRCATRGWRRPCGTRCARRSSSRWASCAAVMPALPLPAAQRERVRRGGGVPEPAAGQRVHRRAQRDGAGLAAQHRAHLPRGGARDDRSAPRHPPRAARPARCERAGADTACRRGRWRVSPGWPRRPGWSSAE